MSNDNPWARFESELAELLGRDRGSVDPEEVESLRARLEACEAGEPSPELRELLEMLAAPEGERDPVPDPGEAYWQDFDRRVHTRIAADADPHEYRPAAASPGEPGAGHASGRGIWLRMAAVAAVLAVVLLLTLPRLGQGNPVVVDQGGAESPQEAVLETLDGLLPGDPSLLEGLDELRAEAAGEDPEGLLDGFDESLGGELDWELLPAGNEPLLPEPEMLDGASREELLNWLRGEETEA